MQHKKESFHESVRKQYEEMRGETYYGTYTPVTAMPILYLRDLDLMQHVMGKQEELSISPASHRLARKPWDPKNDSSSGGRHTVDRQMGECIILQNYDKWENHCRIVTYGRMTCNPIFAFFHLSHFVYSCVSDGRVGSYYSTICHNQVTNLVKWENGGFSDDRD